MATMLSDSDPDHVHASPVMTSETERKQALLAERINPAGERCKLDSLIEDYGSGIDRRMLTASEIVGRYRRFLRKDGPNWDGMLYDDIDRALKAAENYGRRLA